MDFTLWDRVLPKTPQNQLEIVFLNDQTLHQRYYSRKIYTCGHVKNEPYMTCPCRYTATPTEPQTEKQSIGFLDPIHMDKCSPLGVDNPLNTDVVMGLKGCRASLQYSGINHSKEHTRFCKLSSPPCPFRLPPSDPDESLMEKRHTTLFLRQLVHSSLLVMA